MNTAIDTLVSQADDVALRTMANDILEVYGAVASGNLHSAAANSELFQAMSSDLAASTAIFVAPIQNDQIQTAAGRDRFSPAVIDLVVRVQKSTPSFAENVAADVTENTSVGRYLRQIGAVNAQLLAQNPAIIRSDASVAENFKSYQQIVSPMEYALGFTDYSAEYSREDYWPNSDYYQGHANFVNLFRSSVSEKEKSLKFMEYFDSLSPTEQLAAYAWVYDASFETYLSVGPVPSDLPPWISSENLRTLHRTVNDVVMAEFEEQELEMMQ